MAQRVITILSSDISGEEIQAGQGETVTFALDGTTYEIDLTTKEADALRTVLEPYVSAARKAPVRGASARRGGAGSGSGRSPEELTHVRTWAKENGYEVSERGRIRKEILDAFDAAN